ncbi:pyridoxal-dependent decarboxylase domain-containing protein 1 isoform X2 [Aphidius gifuensis]|uniref:pyridoxal-dependent decarboxylase domain-containing protein 1 isoform X2 n=1 Tax=Aphidius gifuensis TaxID=684658 RepID=UPI001CDB8A42|nr:pyridoxal-dependent decarboxylase domain-containing protein 1 isoform X2 [Aphidius gifuensis]
MAEEAAAAESKDPPAMEKNILEASEVISRLEEAVEKNSDNNGSGSTWNNPSGFLSSPKSPETILSLIQDLIIHEDVSQSSDEQNQDHQIQIINLPTLTEATKLSLITHSVSAYALALPRSHAQRLAGRLSADTTRWLSHIFRFVDCASSFHDDPLDGLVRVTRLALHRKYPQYMEDGFTALSTKPPLIYSSSSAPLRVVQYLCRQLSLPLKCIRPIPQNTMFGSKQTMDVSALERKLSEDTKLNNSIPLLVIAEVGSVITGHCDNVLRLHEICDKYNVWLHIRGHSLAALSLTNTTKDLSSKIADSITLPIGIWLGIPALPHVTLYRLTDTKGGRPTQRDTTLSLASGLMTESLSRRLPTLPLWAALQVLGRDGIQEKFNRCFQAIEELYLQIKKYQTIRFLSQIPSGELGTYTTNDLPSSISLTSPQIFDAVSSSIVFQYVPSKFSNTNDNNNIQTTNEQIPAYFDKLNSWLGQILQRDIDNVPIELVDIDDYGIAIRICFLENMPLSPTKNDIDNVVSCLDQQIEILNATVEHKETFIRLVTENESLQLVDMPGWAGLGGVRYTPPAWIQLMTEQTKDELNKLNIQLVDVLRSTDAAFSLGEGNDNLACVRFGMVTQDTDVAELLTLVLQVGQEVEANSKLLDTMSEVVKRGIEAAQTDLERENAEKLWNDGILRHVPVVGSFVNWWNPVAKETGVRGRSLNLQAGVVESTENIYKYHMQLQPNTTNSTSSGARTPPQPLVQTLVGAGSQSHSRSSSHSSLQSGKGVTPNAITNILNTVAQVNEETSTT